MRSGVQNSQRLEYTEPASMGFPHLGQFIAFPLVLVKTKRLCLNKETKAQPSAVPLFLPGRRHSGRSRLPGNGGVRRGLLGFSPLLQGDAARLLPSALHHTAALCASWRRGPVLFCACLPYLSHILSAFRRNVKGKVQEGKRKGW